MNVFKYIKQIGKKKKKYMFFYLIFLKKKKHAKNSIFDKLNS